MSALLRRCVVTLLAFLFVGLPVAGEVGPWFAPAHADGRADDRVDRIRSELADTGLYVEPAFTTADRALWLRRLSTARDRADLGVPVRVALWTQIPGTAPDPEKGEPVRALGDLDRGVLVTYRYSNLHETIVDVRGKDLENKLRALNSQVTAIEEELVGATDDPDRYQGLTAVASVWLLLRLMDDDAPSARKLAATHAGDVTLLVDTADAPDEEGLGDPDESFTALTYTVAGAIVMLMIALVARLAWVEAKERREERRADDSPLPTDAWAERITPLVAEQELTQLSQAIAASDVRPGDPSYDRAQACADAAARYVDSDALRDRVGVHLLAEDGHAALEDRARRRRCYFNPGHDATTSVTRDGRDLPCCGPCASAIADGRRPAALWLPGADGGRSAYYDVDDVWSATGYGAIDERYARRALLAALQGGR